MVKIRNEFAIASVSLIFGALAAPVLYIAGAVLFPQGFADLRHASAQTFIYYFVVAWVTSALFTALIGGSSWHLLHARTWDSFATYAALGGGAAVIIGLVVGGWQNWEPILMAASNGLTVRAIERAIR
jgi:hypothetical protein